MADSDLEVIKRIQNGDADAYADLIRKNHAKIMGLCLSMLGNPTSAEDAAQEIFIKAYRSLDKFQANSAFSTWLYRIAANHCLDLLRQKTREKTDSLEALLDAEGDHAQRLFAVQKAADPSPEDLDLIKRLL